MMVTSSNSGWLSAVSLVAVLAALPGITGCGDSRHHVRDLDPRNARCLTSTRRVNDVLGLGDDGFWAATEGGVLRYSEGGALEAKLTRCDGLPASPVTGLAASPDGQRWVATRRGVARIERGEIRIFAEADGLLDDRVLDVEVAADGMVYVATERGVSRFDGRVFAPFNDTHEFSRRATYDIHEARDGTLWFAKEDALTHFIAESNWEVFQRDPLLPGPRARLVSNKVRAVATDAAHRPWVGTHSGLGFLDADGWRRITFAGRLFDGRGPRVSNVGSVVVDAAGWVWIGHGSVSDFEGGAGAARFRGQEWEYFSIDDGLPDNRVHRIRVADDGVWLATADGVARYRDGRFDAFTAAGELSDNAVRRIARLGEGLIEVSTTSGPSFFQHGVPTDAPPALIREPAAADSSRPPEGEWPFAGQPRVAITDARHRLWVGTRDSGLWWLDGNGWTELRLGGQRLPREISALCFEDDDTLWVGTVTEGALRLDLRGPGG